MWVYSRHTGFWLKGLGFMENQMEENIENQMVTGVTQGCIGFSELK